MDERTAEQLLYVEATLLEIAELAARGRSTYDADIAVARACQYNIIRLTADLERLGDPWLEAHSAIPWRLIKGMRNRVAHNYWTVDDDVVWAVVSLIRYPGVVTTSVPEFKRFVGLSTQHPRGT